MSIQKTITLHGAAILAIALFAFLAISSTLTLPPPVVFDDNMPPEKSIHIYFYPGVEVSSYNGIPVPTRTERLSLTDTRMVSTWRHMILPAGETEFIMDVRVQSVEARYGTIVDIIYTGKDLTFRYTFEPSGDRAYFLWATKTGGTNNDEWGIIISQVLLKKNAYSEEERKFFAFVPFPELQPQQGTLLE